MENTGIVNNVDKVNKKYNIAVAGTGWRLGILQETYPPRILSFPHLVCDLQSVPQNLMSTMSGDVPG